jgi:hypothetical protein
MSWIDELRRLLLRLKGEPATDAPPGGIQCHEAVERVFDWLDDELDPAEAASVGEHLETCARCYPRLQFERAFLEALRRAPSGELVTADLQQRILDALGNEGLSID